MTIEVGLRTRILGISGVDTYVGTNRVYPINAPQGVTGDHIVFEKTENDLGKDLTETTGAQQADFDIDCKASTSLKALAMASLIVENLKDFSGSLSGDTVHATLINDISNDFDKPRDGSQTGFYRVIVDLTMQYTEA